MRLPVVIKWLLFALFFAGLFVFCWSLFSKSSDRGGSSLGGAKNDDVAYPLKKIENVKLNEADNLSVGNDKISKTLDSRAGVVINATTGKIIYAENAFEVLPMASITKIMSAMVALDRNIDLKKEVSISPEDYKIGGNLRIVAGRETVTVKDLFFASITGSANNAAITIAKLSNVPNGDDFVSAMNRKSIELKLDSLHFEEASGLSPENVGSAYDIAKMVGHAFQKYPIIFDAGSRKEYQIVTKNTQREHIIKNPNDLFAASPGEFSASKTGYLDEALYCLALAKRTSVGMIVAVTLGNPSKIDGEQEALMLLKKGEQTIISDN